MTDGDPPELSGSSAVRSKKADSHGDAEGASAKTARHASPSAIALAGAALALIGSVLISVGECGIAAIVVAPRLGGDAFPFGVFVAALGKSAVSYSLLFCPIMAVVGAIHGRVTRPVDTAAAAPFLTALLVLLAGLLVISGDLGLIRRDNLLPWGYVAAAVACALIYLAARFTRRLISASILGAAVRLLTGGAAIFVLVCGVVFVRSPLMNASAYRVPVATPIEGASGRPNVLWILLDTARADRMSAYGYARPTTPFLDEWADKSLVFDRATSNGIWTVPSHCSMFTGLSQREHGASFHHVYLDDQHQTIAEVLRSAGYRTVALTNNPLVSNDTNITKGFDETRVTFHFRHLARSALEYLFEKWGIAQFVPWFDGDFGAAMTNRLVGDWLDEYASDRRPFFMYVNYWEAHLPYRVPKRYRSMFMTNKQVHRSYDLRQGAFGRILDWLDMGFNIEGANFLGAADREVLKHHYDSTIRYVDERTRELIGMYEQRGLLDNTLVIISSDHGEYLDTHGMWAHRYLTYDDLVHVALIIREPGRSAGMRVATPVQPADLYPTILKAVLGETGELPDSSLRDLIALAQAEDAQRATIVEYAGPIRNIVQRMRRQKDPVVMHRASPQIAVVQGGFKFIRSGDGRRELYDLTRDPGELVDLFETNAETAARLDEYISEWLKRTPQYVPDRREGEAIDPGVQRALRALGYIDE